MLEGVEKHPDLGKAPVTFHLGADGSVAASVIDPSATAFGWTGTWTMVDGLLEMTVPGPSELADDLRVSLRLNPKGSGKGTMERDGFASTTSSLKVKATYPGKKAKGWTALVPRLRNGFSTAAGEFRSTVALRRVDTPTKKKQFRPMSLLVRTLSEGGLPGLPAPVLLPPGGTVVLSAASLPPLPPGVAAGALQVEISGGKDFVPESVVVTAVEETLRGTDPAANGAAAPVHWVKALRRREAASLARAPLAAAHFLDDGGAGGTPRETLLVLRDLAPLAGLPPTGSVRVAVLDPAGAEVGAATVALPPRAAVSVRVRDLAGSPGDLPGGEGQVRVTAPDGSGLPRGTVGAVLAGTVRSGPTAVTSTFAAVEAPEEGVSTERLALPYLYLPDDDGATVVRVQVANLTSGSIDLPVSVLGLDGTVLHADLVTAAGGASVRVDPDALGVDRGDLPDGECQIVVGGFASLPADALVGRAEVRLAGDPATVFGAALRFERASAAGAGVVFHAPDVTEAQGGAAGSRDALVVLRNAGDAPRDVTVRAILPDGTPLVPGTVTVTVPAGAAARLSAETLLALLGAPVDPLPAVFRGAFTLSAAEGDGAAWTAVGIALRYSANAVGGYDLPVERR